MSDNTSPKYLNTDEACVLRIKKGEYDAVRVLYERYYKDVMQYIRSKVNEIEDAKDLCSQVFSDVIDDINKLKKADCFQKWLYTIVKYKIINYYRKRKASKITYTDDLESDPPNDYQKLDLEIQSKLYNSTTLNVRSITQQLKPQEQQVLHLRVDLELTYSEIGKLLGKSEEAAKKTVLRAKKKFRRLYLQKYKSPVYSGGEKNEKE